MKNIYYLHDWRKYIKKIYKKQKHLTCYLNRKYRIINNLINKLNNNNTEQQAFLNICYNEFNTMKNNELNIIKNNELNILLNLCAIEQNNINSK